MLASALVERKLGKPKIYHIQDDPDVLYQEIQKLLDNHKILIFSGGVSKGKKDYLPQTLEKLGIEKKLHWVAQRPGKPLWFGVTDEKQPIFGLPGNPLSTLTCFHKYIAPALQHMAEQTPKEPIHVELSKSFSFPPPLTCFLPVKLFNEETATLAIPCPANNSGDYSGILKTSGFIEIPENVADAEKGTHYPFYEW